MKARSSSRRFAGRRAAAIGVVGIVTVVGTLGLLRLPAPEHAAAADGSGPVPSDAVTSLSSLYNITVTDVQITSGTTITASQALATAQDQVEGSAAPSEHLVFYTDPNYGYVVSTDPDNPPPEDHP